MKYRIITVFLVFASVVKNIPPLLMSSIFCD